MKTKKGTNTTLLKSALIIALIIILLVGIINVYITGKTRSKILTPEEATNLREADCILVLGCGLINGKPGKMLEDRLNTAIELYENGVSNKILMSGDHREDNYDEVTAMKNYAMEAGVPSEDIFLDHAGLSTYESIYRAKEIFGTRKIIVITQKYHLYRAVYIAQQFDLEVYGAYAKEIRYVGRTQRELREVLARTKDFFSCIFKPEPTFLGEQIDVNGDGNLTN